MVKHHFQHLSSSQPGDSHIIQDPADYHQSSDNSVLSDIETSNNESSLLKLIEVDRALAVIRAA